MEGPFDVIVPFFAFWGLGWLQTEIVEFDLAAGQHIFDFLDYLGAVGPRRSSEFGEDFLLNKTKNLNNLLFF